MGDALGPVELGAGRSAAFASLGGSHTCVALASSGEVLCWGSSANGLLGLGDSHARGAAADTMGDALLPLQLGSKGGLPLGAVQLAAGSTHTCALLATGSGDDSGARAGRSAGKGGNVIKCWGSNGKGQLGYGDSASRGAAADQMGERLPAVELGPGAEPLAVSTGSAHSCALLEWTSTSTIGDEAESHTGEGEAPHPSSQLEIRCWGSNYARKLGSPLLGKSVREVGATAGNIIIIIINIIIIIITNFNNNNTC
jgi:hypothetical protein